MHPLGNTLKERVKKYHGKYSLISAHGNENILLLQLIERNKHFDDAMIKSPSRQWTMSKTIS